MTDSPPPTVNIDAPSVQNYLTLLQGVINRMAANCTGCKTWCITLVSATIVIIADKQKPDYVWIALVPLALFFVLDAYYLGLERRFRTLYNEFVQKLHARTATTRDVYHLTPIVRRIATPSNSSRNFSIPWNVGVSSTIRTMPAFSPARRGKPRLRQPWTTQPWRCCSFPRTSSTRFSFIGLQTPQHTSLARLGSTPGRRGAG